MLDHYQFLLQGVDSFPEFLELDLRDGPVRGDLVKLLVKLLFLVLSTPLFRLDARFFGIEDGFAEQFVGPLVAVLGDYLASVLGDD